MIQAGYAARRAPAEELVVLLSHRLTPGRKNFAFGDALRVWRRANNFSPSQLARYVGVSPQSIHRWENGYAPRDSQVANLKRVLLRQAREDAFGETERKEERDVRLDASPTSPVQAGRLQLPWREVIGVRSCADVLLRFEQARDIWQVKSQQPFWESLPGAVRAKCVQVLRQSDAPTRLHYLFTTEGSAKSSYEDFRQFMRSVPSLSDLYDQYVQAREIDSSALMAGTPFDILGEIGGWLIIANAKPDQDGAFHDIFLELPVAQYGADGHRQSQYGDLSSPIWIEMPQEVTRHLLTRWEGLLVPGGQQAG